MINVPIKSAAIWRFALRSMECEIAEHPQHETGGILIGYHSPDGLAVVTHATGGGPNSVRASHTFDRDPVYCERELRSIMHQSKTPVSYLGEWHRHCTRGAWLSPPDVEAMRLVAASPGYQCPNPLFIVFGMPDTGNAANRNICAYTLKFDQPDEVSLEVISQRETPQFFGAKVI